MLLGIGLIISQIGVHSHCMYSLGHGVFYTLSLVVPTSLLLMVIALYDHYQMKWIRHYRYL
jgi:hypothetical protein